MDTTVMDLEQRIPILDGMRYFYCKTDTRNYTPTMKITMNDPVELSFLQAAAEVAMARYRHTRLVVVRDDEKFYLADNQNKPIVHAWDGKRRVTGTEENNGHLTWIGMNGNEIIIDLFHGITDGHGMLPFIELLLREYCHLRYGEEAVPDADKVAPTEEIEMNECRDCLSFINTDLIPKSKRKPQPNAFQLTDAQMDAGSECYAYSLEIDAQQFDNYMRCHGSSRSAMVSLFMNWAIAEINDLADVPIVAGVAADLRKIYGAESTLRDCAYMLPICYDHKIRELSWERQLKQTRQMIVDAMDPEFHLTSAVELIRNNQLLNKRVPTLEGKQIFCQRIGKVYQNYTYGLSLVGKVSFGDKLDSHVANISSVMIASDAPIVIVAMQYKEKYYINYCTRLHNDPYLKKFQEKFLEEGISCTCEKRENYLETLAVF